MEKSVWRESCVYVCISAKWDITWTEEAAKPRFVFYYVSFKFLIFSLFSWETEEVQIVRICLTVASIFSYLFHCVLHEPIPFGSHTYFQPNIKHTWLPGFQRHRWTKCEISISVHTWLMCVHAQGCGEFPVNCQVRKFWMATCICTLCSWSICIHNKKKTTHQKWRKKYNLGRSFFLCGGIL